MIFFYSYNCVSLKILRDNLMFRKGIALTFKLFIILFLCCLIILCFIIWNEMNKSYELVEPNGKGITFFTHISGLLILYFTFFGVCSLWIFLARFFTRDFKKYAFISFIPIFIFYHIFCFNISLRKTSQKN